MNKLKIVLLSGHICSGKSKLANRLIQEHSFYGIKTGEIIKDIIQNKGIKVNRLSLQKHGDAHDKSSNEKWILHKIMDVLGNAPTQCSNDVECIVVDSVRTYEQIKNIRNQFGISVIHIHLSASRVTLKKRFNNRRITGRESDKKIKYEEAILSRTESNVDHLYREADIFIDTDRCDEGDTFVQVAARIGLYAPPSHKCVDVIFGGQYGSEGKGQIAAYLSRNYDVLMRVGGPNAGHSVKNEKGKYVYHHLPSGCKDSQAEIIIGPGAVINSRNIVKEIEECDALDRISIDPQAMTISSKDIKNEQSVVGNVGSTGSGTGRATARKITERGKSSITLARDDIKLSPFLNSSFRKLERAYASEKKILLEGTQGSALSIHHGHHPHVTSRDTNVTGCLAEAGISVARVRRVIMVVRTYPIRVASPNDKTKTSGFLKKEISFSTVAKRSGLNRKTLKKAEKTSTTKRDRRVGEFDWEQFRHACSLNVPTDIVLTFVDYIDIKNENARRIEQLTEETLRFIETLEQVSHAPVSMISTGFGMRAIIDRRDW